MSLNNQIPKNYLVPEGHILINIESKLRDQLKEHYYSAQLFKNDKKYSEALSEFNLLLKISLITEDNKYIFVALNESIFCYTYLKMYNETINMLLVLESHLRGIEKNNMHFYTLTDTYKIIGKEFESAQKYDEAFNFYLKRKEIAIYLNDTTIFDITTRLILSICLKVKKEREIIQYLKNELNNVTTITTDKNDNVYAEICCHLGTIYLRKFSYKHALFYYKKSIEKYMITQNIIGQVLVWNNISNVYVKHNNYGKALSAKEKEQKLLAEYHESIEKLNKNII